MKTILAIMGILVAAFVLTTTLEGAYALKQENEQKAIQVQDNDQDNKAKNQAGFLNNQINKNDQDQKSFQKADNTAKCNFAVC